MGLLVRRVGWVGVMAVGVGGVGGVGESSCHWWVISFSSNASFRVQIELRWCEESSLGRRRELIETSTHVASTW